jgi:hypothetical protein
MRDIKGYEGLYAVTSCGKVWSHTNKRFLNPQSNGCSYYQVNLSKGGKTRHFFIHRLVAGAYLDNPNDFPQVNHLDENKANNAVTNLQWCTVKENANHGTRNSRISKAKIGVKKIK